MKKLFVVLLASVLVYGCASSPNKGTVSKSGEIERWPIVEITATPAPAEYRMQPIELLKSAYQEIGCTDFSCVLKKFGVESEGDNQGVVKTRLLAELENLRIEADLL